MERLGFSFTLDQIIEKVRELITARPFTEYHKSAYAPHRCSYAIGESITEDNYGRETERTPGCLFGMILPQEWVDEDFNGDITTVLANIDPDGESRTLLEDRDESLLFHVPDADNKDDVRVQWLRCVQREQDQGTPWHAAMSVADNNYTV